MGQYITDIPPTEGTDIHGGIRTKVNNNENALDAQLYKISRPETVTINSVSTDLNDSASNKFYEYTYVGSGTFNILGTITDGWNLVIHNGSVAGYLQVNPPAGWNIDGELQITLAPCAKVEILADTDTSTIHVESYSGDVTGVCGVSPKAFLYLTAPEDLVITAGTPISPSANISVLDGNISEFEYTGGSLKYIGEIPRTFALFASWSLTSDTNNVIGKSYFGKNGVVDTRSLMQRKIATGLDVGAVASQWMVSVIKNDTLDFFMDASVDATFTIQNAQWYIQEVK